MKKILTLGVLAVAGTQAYAKESPATSHETSHGTFGMKNTLSTFGDGFATGLIPVVGLPLLAVYWAGNSHNRLKEMSVFTMGHLCGAAVLYGSLYFAAKGVYYTLSHKA